MICWDNRIGWGMNIHIIDISRIWKSINRFVRILIVVGILIGFVRILSRKARRCETNVENA